jgi:hypothetical protein
MAKRSKNSSRPWIIEPDSECASLVQFDGADQLAVTYVKGKQTYQYSVSSQERKAAKKRQNPGSSASG